MECHFVAKVFCQRNVGWQFLLAHYQRFNVRWQVTNGISVGRLDFSESQQPPNLLLIRCNITIGIHIPLEKFYQRGF